LIFNGQQVACVPGPAARLGAQLLDTGIVGNRQAAGFDIFEYGLQLVEMPVEGRTLTADLFGLMGFGL
jgi:hypothetical protein